MGKLHILNDGVPIVKDVENPSYLCVLGRTTNDDENENDDGMNDDVNDDGSGGAVRRRRIARRPSAIRDGGICVVSEVREGSLRAYAIRIDARREGGGRRDGRGGDDDDIDDNDNDNDDDYSMRATASGGAVDTGGSYPCHVAWTRIDHDGGCIVVCNYGVEEGALSLFAFGGGCGGGGGGGETANIPIVPIGTVPLGPGSCAIPDRQGSSHAHSTSVSTSASRSRSIDLFCADLGSDAIVRFRIDRTTTTTTTTNESIAEDGGGQSSFGLSCTETGRICAPTGSGPRSIAFNPVHGNIAIVSLEMTAEVWLVCGDANTGNYDSVGDTISLLPEDWPSASDEIHRFNRGRWASDAVWSPCGGYAYVAARLHNSLTVLRLSTTTAADESSSGSAAKFEPRLRFVQRISTNGLTPRCLCMSECGKFILVAHQHSHDVSSFGRNEYDGTIAFIDRLEAPNAACVKLIRPDEIGTHDVDAASM